jgi:hypothetical protein
MNAEHADLEARFAAPAERDLPPGRHQQHRENLMNHMLTTSGPAGSAPPGRPRRPRRTVLAITGTAVVAVGAAAAVAVALAAAPAPAPGRHVAAGGQHAPTAAHAAKAARPPVNAVLAQLAADITVRQVRLPGNATLEIRNQTPSSDQIGDNGVDLYTDNGTYYWALSKSMLPQVIAQHQDVGQGQFKRAMAAALLAVKGDLATARARMTVANLIPGTHPYRGSRRTEIQKLKAVARERHVKYVPPKPLTPAQRKEQTDNLIWMNSIDALTAAPQNANVRAGVLDIMATMPKVKVTHTTTGGQPTLTLADSWPLFTKGLVESLVINASTGLPVALFNTQPGQPLNATYYHSWRVTLAHVEAGKF